MLALSRTVHESIILHVPGLAEPIRIKVLESTGSRKRGRRVKLGFEADRAVKILREEIEHIPA